MKKEIIITGAHGFLGRHAARFFAGRGFVVRGIGHGHWQPGELEVWGISDWRKAEVTIDALDPWAGQPYAIVHCAGGSSVSSSFVDPLADFHRTVTSIAEVLAYVRTRSPRSRVVFPSSASVYGFAKTFPIAESALVAPVSPYGTHKYLAETLIVSFAKLFQIPACVIRFFSLYGEELRKQILWDACRKLAGGDPTFAGSGFEVRDWLHVDDAVALLESGVENASSSCPIVNGGSGEGVCVKDLLSYLAQRLEVNLEPKFSGEHRPGDPDRYIADTAKATALGWKPRRSWQQGVAEYAAWWCRFGPSPWAAAHANRNAPQRAIAEAYWLTPE